VNTPVEPSWCVGPEGDEPHTWHGSEVVTVGPFSPAYQRTELKLVAQVDFPQIWLEMTVYRGIFDSELGEVDEPYRVIFQVPAEAEQVAAAMLALVARAAS
jgi:hypothetical protein